MNNKKKSLGITLLAGTVIGSNLLLLIWYYLVPPDLQKQIPPIVKTFFPIVAVFPQEVFGSYLRDFVEMRLFWIATMLACAIGIYRLNRLARTVFIVFNIIHIVTLTYVVAMKLGKHEFLDYFFKLYFNMVAVLTYVGFLTILEVREQFQIVIKESGLSLWFKKLTLVSAGPRSTGNYYDLGLAYSRLERYDDAIDLLKKAADLNPKEADIHFQTGVIYIKQKKYHPAINAFKEAIRLDPLRVESYANIGIAYQQEGCDEEAIRAFEKAGHMKPDHPDVFRHLGESYESAGKYKEALGAFNQAARLNPHDHFVYYRLGAIYLNHLEQFAQAREALQKAIRLNSNQLDAHFQLGLACLKLNAPKDAIRAFKEVLRLESDHRQGHYHLGVAYATIGDTVSAQRQYQQLRQLDPDAAENLKMFIK